MTERGWGRIVNISSIAARTGAVSQAAAYAATKAGLIALTKNFARNYGPHGVTVNAVAPAGIDTPMLAGQMVVTPSFRETLTRQIPLQRIADPSEGRLGGGLSRLGWCQLRHRRDPGCQRRLVHVLTRRHEFGGRAPVIVTSPTRDPVSSTRQSGAALPDRVRPGWLPAEQATPST